MAKHKKIEWEGEEYTLPELARKFGLGPETLRYRLKIGVSLEDALTAERLVPRTGQLLISSSGESDTVARWAKKLGVSERTLYDKRRKGEVIIENLLIRPPQKTVTSSSGETLTVSEWSKKLGRNESTLRTRIRQGWEPDEILGLVERPRTRRKGE